MKFRIKMDDLEKTVDYKNSKALIESVKKGISSPKSVEMSLIQSDDDVIWKSSCMISNDSFTDVKSYVRNSFTTQGYSDSEAEEWLKEFDEEVKLSEPTVVPVAQTVPEMEEKEEPKPVEPPTEQPKPVEDNQEEWEPVEEPKQKKHKSKKVKQKAVKVDKEFKNDDVADEVTAIGTRVVKVSTTWQVALLAICVPLIYFTALTLILKYFEITNEWLLIGIPLASAVVIIWYITSLISSAKRKIMEKTITKEVFVYVGQEQLRRRHLLTKEIQNYNNLFAPIESLQLKTTEDWDKAGKLLEETSEITD